jgi:hypothetical protein
MKKIISFYCLFSSFFLLIPAPGISQSSDWTDNLDLYSMVQPVPQANKFTDPGYYVWCGSVTKGDDGKFYMLYSRWPLDDGFESWPVTSEIAVAVSDKSRRTF